MEDFDNLYYKALRFLSYRPRSEREIRDRLKLKSQNSKLIDKVIEKLKQQKFLNDEEFARGWIENRLRFKPRSLRLIKIELKQKGISPAIISNSKFLISNDEESARKIVQKRIGRLKGLDKQKIYEKLGRYLASKGFNWDTIKKAIDPVKS